MQQIIENLRQSLINEHVPSEQIQSIVSSVDMSKINLQDLPATTEYLNQFLTGMGLESSVIEIINSNIAENFGSLGIDSIGDLGVSEDGIVGTIKNIFGGFFGE